MQYDVVFFDEVGMEYVESDDENGALGGSELEVTILTSELAKRGFKVLVENRNRLQTDTASSSGAVYRRIGSHQTITTHTLVVMRYSHIPAHVDYDNLIVWLHDIPSHDAAGKFTEHAHWLTEPEEKTFVCVSQWHAERFPMKTVVIPNMLPASNFTLKPSSKVPGRFHYASGAMKGLEETLQLWRHFYARMKREGARENPELHIFTPAWSAVAADGQIGDGIVCRGPVTPSRDFLKEISKSEGMFYVNKLPENFCISAAQTELLGGRVHVLCLNGVGGLRDTLSRPEWIFEVTNPGVSREEFESSFFRALEEMPLIEGRKPGFHPDVLMPIWLDVLDV